MRMHVIRVTKLVQKCSIDIDELLLTPSFFDYNREDSALQI